jgi:mannose/fructose/N-acetylgalactosamine-specific phosphotransferase system component IIC
MALLPTTASLATAGLAALVPAGDPAWTPVLLLGLFGGLLALDDTALAQTWFSQPLPVGVLTGAVCGDPLSGLAVGLPVQLILAANLPVGQSFTGDATSAVVAAVGAAVLSGYDLVPALGADARVQASLVGWLVLAVGLLSGLGHILIQAERRAHSLWMREGHRTLRDGRLQRVEMIHLRCLVTTFLRGFFTTVILLLVLRRFWLPVFPDLPGFLRGALVMVPLLVPGLGIGNLVERYGLRDSWAWLIGGAVLSFSLARFVL